MDSSIERTAEELGMDAAQVELVIKTHQKIASEELQVALAEFSESLAKTFPLHEG